MGATTSSQSGRKTAVARIGGTSASGGPKNGMSMARADTATMRKPYGRPSEQHDRER